MKQSIRKCYPALVVAILAFAMPSFAGTSIFTETFTSTAFENIGNTTAFWDTAGSELKLPPFVPTLAGSYNTPSEAWGVVVAGDHAFVADYRSGLQIIDISNPTMPTLTGA